MSNDISPSRRPAGRGSAPGTARAPSSALLALALALGACRAGGDARVPPAPAAASIAFAEAEALLAAGDEAAARASIARSLALDPGWVAPARALDDLDRAALLGPDVLARRRQELAEAPDSGALHYLVGRLEETAGIARFERGVVLAPDLAWNYHGLAWNAHLSGATRAALRDGRRARERARDTWERTYFTVSAARYELALGRPERAVELCLERLLEPDVLASDRPVLQAWLAQSELRSARPALAERGYRRGLELIATADVPAEELTRLVAALLEAPAADFGGRYGSALDDDGVALEVGAALAARDGAGRRPLRAALLLDAGSPALALALLADDPAGARARDWLRALRFARGRSREAVEAWLAALPGFLVGEDGLPRDARLGRVVLAARGDDQRELGQALLEAGWFAEARALSEHLASEDLEAALALEAHASAGVVLLAGIERVLRAVDRGHPYGGPWASASPREADAAGEPDPPDSRPIESLDELLAALEALFEGFHLALDGAPRDVDLASSPRASYGPAGEVVHPGPVYSAADAERGLGERGAPVAGLAAELDGLGRFGIFGQALGGGGPDGTLLRRLLIEERSGEHLGVPWKGAVAWCEGADVDSRPGRRGARIAGAALHEGYWIDVASVREDHAQWVLLAERFLAPGREAALAAALEVRGVPAESSEGLLVPLLGAAERVRLRVLADRAAARAAQRAARVDGGAAEDAGSLVTLEELLLLTALHEEGHLCDRTRFLPIGKNLLGALRLLAAGGFTPAGVARELEERAELVCLAEAPDPRMPLSDVLAAAELGSSVTPHAAAYRALLAGWLEMLAELARDGGRFAALDRTRAFAHQLHHLAPEEVREVSLALARRRGLLGSR